MASGVVENGSNAASGAGFHLANAVAGEPYSGGIRAAARDDWRLGDCNVDQEL
jgi:hypothetical protein